MQHTDTLSNSRLPTYADLYALFDRDPSPVVDFVNWVTADRQYHDLLDVGCGTGRLLSPPYRIGLGGYDRMCLALFACQDKVVRAISPKKL